MVQLKRKGHTKVTSNDKVTEVKLYNTIVVSFDSKHITLNNGGWQTVTTKARMNQASQEFNLGFSVYQVKGNWIVSFKGKEIEYTNGMILRR